MRKTIIHEPKTGLPVIGAQASMILGKNLKRVGLIINNYGTQTVFIYDGDEIIAATNGFSIFAGFGLAMMQQGTCPQSALYAGQAAAGGILNIIEIVEDEK